jgi:hypothetical protein
MTMGERGYYFARIVDHGTTLSDIKKWKNMGISVLTEIADLNHA